VRSPWTGTGALTEGIARAATCRSRFAGSSTGTRPTIGLERNVRILAYPTLLSGHVLSSGLQTVVPGPQIRGSRAVAAFRPHLKPTGGFVARRGPRAIRFGGRWMKNNLRIGTLCGRSHDGFVTRVARGTGPSVSGALREKRGRRFGLFGWHTDPAAHTADKAGASAGRYPGRPDPR